METESLTEIVTEAREVQEEIDKVKHLDINNYIIEIIRISKMYRFKLNIKPNIKKQQEKQEQSDTFKEEKFTEIEEDLPKQDLNQYLNVNEFTEDVKIIYGEQKIEVDYSEYKQEKPKVRLQELWEKEGFYQEKTTQAKLRVQIWPEHLPYDHLKRKRAFLFC